MSHQNEKSIIKCIKKEYEHCFDQLGPPIELLMKCDRKQVGAKLDDMLAFRERIYDQVVNCEYYLRELSDD